MLYEPTEEDMEMIDSMPEEMRTEYLRTAYLFHHAALSKRNPEFLIDGFLPLGYCVILAGDPKAGKTALASAIALAAAEGSPFAAMETKQGGVLWLALEESREERATVMAPVLDRIRETNFYVTHQKIAIDTDEGLHDLDRWVTNVQARLIVVDPLHAAHSGRSLNDGWRARRTLAPFKKFCGDRNVTGLVLHHIGSGGNRVAENAQLAACAGMSMLYSSQPSEEGRIVRLQTSGRGDFANCTWFFESRGPLSYWPANDLSSVSQWERTAPRNSWLVVTAAKAQKPTLEDEIVGLLTDSPQALPASDIAGALQRNANSIRNALSRLIHQKRVRWAHTISGTRYYGVPDEDPSNIGHHADPDEPELLRTHFSEECVNDDECEMNMSP